MDCGPTRDTGRKRSRSHWRILLSRLANDVKFSESALIRVSHHAGMPDNRMFCLLQQAHCMSFVGVNKACRGSFRRHTGATHAVRSKRTYHKVIMQMQPSTPSLNKSWLRNHTVDSLLLPIGPSWMCTSKPASRHANMLLKALLALSAMHSLQSLGP